MSSLWQLGQCDLAFVPRPLVFNKQIGFLLAIDCFSHRVFTRSFSNKQPSEILKRLDSIIAEGGMTISVLQTDQGSEFKANKAEMEKRSIKLVFKGGPNKVRLSDGAPVAPGSGGAGSDKALKPLKKLHFQAGYAEAAIRRVKDKLFANITYNKDRDWPSFLPAITKSINDSPCISIGNLAPSSIQSGLDEPKVRLAQKQLAETMSDKQRNHYFPAKDSYKTMVDSASSYDQDQQQFSLGEFVYRDIIKGPLEKGTSDKRKEVCIISEIIKNRSVTRYGLLNLNFSKLVGPFYKQNLRRVPVDGRPTSLDFYKIDFIVRYGDVDGEPSALVRWVGLDESKDTWLPKKNLVLSKE